MPECSSIPFENEWLGQQATLDFMQVGHDQQTSTNCKSKLWFGLDKQLSTLVLKFTLTSLILFSSGCGRTQQHLPTCTKPCTLAAIVQDYSYMFRYLLTIPSLLIVSVCFGQQYHTDYIIKKADSILISAVGQRVFEDYYHFDPSSYYDYKNNSAKTKWKGLTPDKRTIGKFIKVSVRYQFCLHKYDTPCNTTFVEFDSSLSLTKPLNFEFIPSYALLGDSCNLISDSSAIRIANNNFKEKGLYPVRVYLEWDYKEKLYVWTAENFLTAHKTKTGNDYGEMELIRINAINGTILSQRKSEYGFLH